MPALNIIIGDNSIIEMTRRISFDEVQLTTETHWAEFWALPTSDYYEGYVYAFNATDLATIKTWMDGYSFTYGSDEDITPESTIQDWLDNYEVTEKIGGKSKTDVYTDLVVTYPAQECIGL